MSTPISERPLSSEEERGKPVPSENHGAVQANLIPPLHTIQILTADGGEQTLNSGIATVPVTSLTANFSVVFS